MSSTTHMRREVSRFSPSRMLRTLQTSYTEFHGPAPSKLPAIGMMGVFANPFYYFVWFSLFPQPYESLPLRLAGAALCLPIALRSRWPNWLAPFYLRYCYMSLMLAGPAFFTFMLLMNHVNSVWLMSTTAILLFTMLLYDFANAIVVTAIGSVIAVVAFWLHGGSAETLFNYLLLFPVFAFVLAAVAFLSHSQSLISQDRLLAARAFAGSVAHEMRTPLLGIRFDVESLDASLQRLNANDQYAPESSAMDPGARQAAQAAVGRIRDQVSAANLVIDMLLLNLRQGGYRGENLELCRIADTLNVALEKYPFHAGERDLVTLRIANNFAYQGVEVLMIHVIYNLIKNGLRAVAGIAEGRIVIEADVYRDKNRVTVSDTGRGIDPLVLPFIFIPFVTGNQDMGGSGVGLSFCRGVVEGFGGTISCSSDAAAATRFTILLPRPDPAGPETLDRPA